MCHYFRLKAANSWRFVSQLVLCGLMIGVFFVSRIELEVAHGSSKIHLAPVVHDQGLLLLAPASRSNRLLCRRALSIY